jgi:rod shape-determining protein MreD
MGLIQGRRAGLWTGFFSGLLTDLFYGSVFGFYALVYMYVGYLCGYAHRNYYDNDIRVPVCMSLIADLGYNLCVWGLQFLLRGRLNLGTYLLRIILPEAFYTTALTFLIYRLIRIINYRYLSADWKDSDSIWIIK